MPPSVDQLMPALDNWEKYIHYEEKDPLVQLAMVKVQFEIIHPFLDGNGRIGRMLIPLFLYEKKLLSSPMFYLSAYLERNRDIYYDRLKGVSRRQDWDGWISFFLNGIIEQAEDNIRKTHEILALYDKMKQILPETIKSHYNLQAIDSLFDRPIFRITDFIERSQIPKDSARRIINALRKKGIIDDLRPGKGRRPAVLIFPELLKITEGTR